MLEEVREVVHIQEFAGKHRVVRRYNSTIVPREMKEDDLVLRQVVEPRRIGKLLPN